MHGLETTAQLADLAAVPQRRGLARVDDDAVQLHPTPAASRRRARENGDRAAAAVRLLRPAAPPTRIPDVANIAAARPGRHRPHPPARRRRPGGGLAAPVRGAYLRSRGEPRTARALFEDAHDLYRQRLGPDHPDTLAAARTLADDLEALRDPMHARRLREDPARPDQAEAGRELLSGMPQQMRGCRSPRAALARGRRLLTIGGVDHTDPAVQRPTLLLGLLSGSILLDALTCRSRRSRCRDPA